MRADQQWPEWLQRAARRDEAVRLWGAPFLVLPSLAGLFFLWTPPILLPSPVWLVLILGAFTPGALALMWEIADRRSPDLQPDDRTRPAITRGLLTMAAVLAATFVAALLWGPVAAAVGAVAYYVSTWFAAQPMAIHIRSVRQRRDEAREAASAPAGQPTAAGE